MKFVIPAIILSAIAFAAIWPGPYKDGIYEGKSRARYINEPFIGMVRIEIRNGHFFKIDFTIVDTLKKENFDSSYAKYFTGNEIYTEQCRKDWKGVQYYPKRLLETQDIEKVDAISGATWSYNIFKQSSILALKNACK
jgi:major membrane immunogen (membrane-anchored lipoprotein)